MQRSSNNSSFLADIAQKEVLLLLLFIISLWEIMHIIVFPTFFIVNMLQIDLKEKLLRFCKTIKNC